MLSTPRIIQGTWDEIATHAQELGGRQLTVFVSEPREGQEEYHAIDAKNAAAIAYLQSRLDSASSDPASIKRAEEELDELLQSINQNRLEVGDRPLFAK